MPCVNLDTDYNSLLGKNDILGFDLSLVSDCYKTYINTIYGVKEKKVRYQYCFFNICVISSNKSLKPQALVYKKNTSSRLSDYG